jgi:hypothetical protein
MTSNTQELEATYTGAATLSVDVRDFTRGRVSTGALAGELSGAVFTVDQSLNGLDFFSTGTTVSAENITSEIDLEGVAFLRVRVTTASSASATARVTIYAERA